MERAMSTGPAMPHAATRPAVRRDPSRRILGGVCAGIGKRLGVDPLLVRVGFIALALAGGLGVALYALAWMAIPAAEGVPHAARRFPAGRGSIEVALGTALLVLSVLLVFRELGVWFSDAVVWPLVLVAAGAALLWRQSAGAADPGTAGEATTPLRRTAATVAAPQASADTVRERAALVSRTSLGVALVIAAGLAFLQATGSLTAARDVVLAVLVVVIVLGVIFAPWIVRLGRSLTAERAERIRSQERAELAAHLHDSVLQTLAMVQKRSADPREVASLARRQERELRSWLSGRPAPAQPPGRLAAALEQAAQEVEAAQTVPIELVTVGDGALDGRAEALVAATREAIVNAAKFAGGSPVAVYAELSGESAQVFVRDRGPGFDPDAIPPDRRGVREAIGARMERHGGRARIASTPGSGTEVELSLDRTQA
jgi:signal transduction histidine kinase/phage shock protein PspC (stress-responsive transcriptional regulator)